MSHGIETIDLEDELDYELDVDMNPEQEDALLDEDNCDSPEPENELVRKMSMTSVSVSSVQPPETVAPNEPSMPLYPPANNFWSQSLSTFANVLQTNAAETTNTAIEPEKCEIDLSQIQPPVIDVIPPVQIQQVIVVDDPKSETESFELKAIDSTSEGLTCTSSSSSSTPTSSSMKVNVKRNRNKKRRLVKLNPLYRGFGLSKPVGIPSLMSIDTQLTFPRSRFASLSSADLPTPTTRSRVPFIIQAQTNGTSVSRKITVNPAFEGFPSTKISSTILNRNRGLSGAVSSLDFSNVVINKRRSTISLESIVKASDKITTDPTALAALPMSIDTGEMSDDDKKYLMAIEEQKKKREEVLRQKEWKRDIDGWQFLHE